MVDKSVENYTDRINNCEDYQMAENEQVTQLWKSLTAKLATDDRMTPQLQGFLNLIRPVGVMGETLYLEVPNSLTRTMIEQKLSEPLTDTLADPSNEGGPSNFAIVINPEIETAFETPSATEPQAMVPQAPLAPLGYLGGASTRSISAGSFDSRLNPKYTFDSFVTGNSNRFAHAAAFAVAEAPAKAYNPLFIYGNSGLGKTHLLHAIGHYAMNLYPKIKVRYVSSEEFTNDFINAIQNNRTVQFQSDYREIDLLLIDDIQFLQGKDQTQEAFFHTFNSLYGHSKQVVITSDLQPKQLTGFEDRMITRFEWGLLTDIQAPELETRIAILRKKAETENLRVPDEIIEYMAMRVASNIRELEGTLIRVTAFANLNRTPVDMQLVQTVLKDIVPLGESNVITAAEIIKAVSAYYKISADDLPGSSRAQAIALARQVAMYICREQTNLSLPKIGQLFGNRDHTTVMYACKKVNDLMKERRYVYNSVSEIITKIKTDTK